MQDCDILMDANIDRHHSSNGIRPKPAHMICDIPGKPNVSKIYPPKRLKPGPLARVDRSEIRDRYVTVALTDSEWDAFETFRKSYPFRPTKSTFGAWVIAQWMDANRRKDV